MSDTIDTGGNTFPAAKIDDDGNIIGITLGMTLRDHFAGLAMQGIAANDKDYPENRTATEAYLYADAMIKARKEQS